MMVGPKPKASKHFNIKVQSILSNAFSKSINNNMPGMFCCFVYSITSIIDLATSPMNLSLTSPVWLVCIISGRTLIILAAITLEAILASTLIKDIGLLEFSK